jgi:hypothetical protein
VRRAAPAYAGAFSRVWTDATYLESRVRDTNAEACGTGAVDVAQRLVGWLVHHLNVDASVNVADPEDAAHGDLEVGAGAGL